jgi:hypothetical protein
VARIGRRAVGASPSRHCGHEDMRGRENMKVFYSALIWEVLKERDDPQRPQIKFVGGRWR